MKNCSILSKPSEKLDEYEAKIQKKHGFFKEFFADFTANSSLHGLSYIGKEDCVFIEKAFWFIAFLCSVGLSTILIRQVYIKWDETPVIVILSEKLTPVDQIPIPAITICLETKSAQTKFNFTKYFHLYYNNNTYDRLTAEERNLFEDVSMVCDDHLAPPNGRNFSSGFATVNNIKELSPNITDAFLGCKWKGLLVNCSELFSPILLEEGQCFTFNTLSADEMFRSENLHDEYPYLEHDIKAECWSLDKGYDKCNNLDTYPYRGSGYGVKSALQFVVQMREVDLDYLCRSSVQGLKILLHNPAELPRISQQFFRTPLSQESVVVVKPKLMTTAEALRLYKPWTRQCYFQTERYLRYFKVYTEANCNMECLSNFTYTRCGCVHFGMPREPNMTVCNAGSMACIQKSQDELDTIEIQARLQRSNDFDDDSFKQAREVASHCQCLPACTSMEYETEISQAEYDIEALYSAFRIDLGNENCYSRVSLYFKEAQFITSRRSELYGKTDFLANCGGLLGLFLGFSVLSVAEIIYFLTLRPICTFFMRQRENKRIEQDSK